MISPEHPSLPVPRNERVESEDALNPEDEAEMKKILDQMIDPSEEHLERLKQKLAESQDAADVEAVFEDETEMSDRRRADKEAIEEILSSSLLENGSAEEIAAKIEELKQKIDPQNLPEIEKILAERYGRDPLNPGIIIAFFALKGVEASGEGGDSESTSAIADGLKNYLGWPGERLPFAETGEAALGLLIALLLINSIALGDWMQKYGKRELRRMHLPRAL